MNIFNIIFNTIKKINFVDLSAIFVNLSILWIFYKTYFSKNLKVLSINSGFNTFFGRNISITIQNKTLKTFVIDRITIVLNDGKYLMLDFSEQNITSRTIEIFKRVTLKYNFSELTNEVNLFSVNINRFEIYCGSDIITSYFCKKKLFKLLNRKIKKKEKIGFLIYYSDNTIISPEVKYLIQKVNKDRKIDKNIYVTDYGYCSTELYKYEKEGGFVGYNAFPENVVQNEDIFLNYLKNENFINDEKWLISLVGKQSVINNNENTNE